MGGKTGDNGRVALLGRRADMFEADNIRAALKAAGGKVSGPGGAAQLIGMKPTTLASRIKALGIVPPRRT